MAQGTIGALRTCPCRRHNISSMQMLPSSAPSRCWGIRSRLLALWPGTFFLQFLHLPSRATPMEKAVPWATTNPHPIRRWGDPTFYQRPLSFYPSPSLQQMSM